MTNLNDALINATPISAVVRTGIVTNWNPTDVQVNIGGSEIQAAFLDWYQPPIVGDLVAVIKQDSSWLVLGRYAGAGSNLVANASFEDSAPTATAAPGTVPVNWGQFVVTTTGVAPLLASVNVITDADAPQAGQVAEMDPHASAAAVDVVLTSGPISVNPGESIWLSAYVANGTFVPSVAVSTPPVNVQLMACWFGSDTETFPSASQTEDYTMVQRIPNVRKKPPYSFLSGSATAPATASIMRVGLRAEFPAATSSTIRWDYVTARRAFTS